MAKDLSRVELSTSREHAAGVLADARERGEAIAEKAGAIRAMDDYSEWGREFSRWHGYALAALQSISVGSGLEEEFQRRGKVGYIGLGDETLADRIEDRLSDIRSDINVIRGVEERLSLLPVPDGLAAKSQRPQRGRQVFVVHGRHRDSADVVARFVEKLELKAIILDEQANEGRTLLEKLEHSASQAGFAVVLLQADDYACGPGGAEFPSAPNRARQNVILELGFFVGLLGRRHVAALVEPGVEQPSDIHGLAYVPFDDSWQMRLAKELKSSMPDLDLNRAF
jgi:predicted nucleotide-binding protein